MWFTDSPYERLMTQVHTERKETLPVLVWPPGHPCVGCPFDKGSPCIGVCYRELLRRRQ